MRLSQRWMPRSVTCVAASLAAFAASAAAQTPAGLEAAFALVRPFALKGPPLSAPARWNLPAPGTSKLDGAPLLAYEEHARFTYAALDGAALYAGEQSARPTVVRRLVHCKPDTIVVDDLVRGGGAEIVRWTLDTELPLRIDKAQATVTGADGTLVVARLFPADAAIRAGRDAAHRRLEIAAKRAGPEARCLNVLHLRRPAPTWQLATQLRSENGRRMTIEVATQEGKLQLTLNPDPIAPGTIAIRDAQDRPVLARRVLPSGVLPHGPEGAKLLERWDSAYRSDQRPPWDIGRPASQLQELVESGGVQPCRAVELGSGPGNDSVFLAKRGFEMTAVDIAPTALARAHEKARAAEVRIRWVLADVTAIPNLGTFDFLYDRGCYHGVRRQAADKYVQTLKKLTHAGSQILILAGNANEPPPHTGPPRVKESELRGDFADDFEIVSLKESRFDSTDAAQRGPLAWIILLRRK